MDEMPAVVVAARHALERSWLDTLMAPQANRRKTVRAAVAHTTASTTWQSLCAAQGLSDRSAVELMVGMVIRVSR
jgi:hypothetical protein